MPAQRLSMRKLRDILRLKLQSGLSVRQIHRSLRMSVGTVSKILQKAQTLELDYPVIMQLDDSELAKLFYPNADTRLSNEFEMPDWFTIHKELMAKGMTRYLLWEEYAEQYPTRSYGYAQFCHHYLKWSKQQKRSMRQIHKAGEKLFVDYAGQTVPIVCGSSGEVRTAQIFVAVMGASNYTYAEATYTQTLSDWVQSHARCFTFLGGVPEIVVPDNLKSGVTKACNYDPDVNPTYQQLAVHYGVAIVPARPYKPKDKAKAEVGVQIIERWILARIRYMTFFSLAELNQTIKALLDDVNNRHSMHLKGSRKDWFEAIDKPNLSPLPMHAYEYTDIKPVKVNIDYHVQYDDHFYSVPHHLVGERIELHAKFNTIDVYFCSNLVANHARQYRYGMTTTPAHMPSKHEVYHKWDKRKLVNWAKNVGPASLDWVETQFQRKSHNEQAFRVCLGMLNLAKKYPNGRLDKACAIANRHKLYRLKQIKDILKSNQDKLLQDTSETASTLPQVHENIRGPQSFH
jgi:transposase